MYVPDFELVHEDSALSPSKKPSVMEDDIIELLWQNGQVVTQSQNSLRSLLKKPQHQPPLPAQSPPSKFDLANNPQSTARIHHQQQQQQQQRQLFMQEDEMTSWLHHDANFPDQDDFFPAGFLYPPHLLPPPPSSSGASSSTTTVAAPLPQPVSRTEAVANFPLFSRQRVETAPSGNRSFPAAVVRESTVVDSSVNQAVCGDGTAGKSGGAANSNTTTNRETASETSSPGGSSASVEPSHQAPTAGGWQKPPRDHGRKRKGVDEDLDYRSEDTEFESDNPKKQPQLQRSTSTKRSRAAEVHNLSERRRRDRINEKMKALQELIPRCNKSDKASMLDEAIEYLKSLQLQVQMMSMGCGMVPMMFPGVQQYMSPIGMGLGVGMGMEMSMNRPMMPFHNVLAGASLPAAAAHLGPRFSAPAFHMPPVPTDPNRMQGAGPRDSMLNSAGLAVPNFTDPYHQYLSLHQMQLPISQNQASVHSNGSGKPSNSQGTNNLVNNLSGQ